MKHFVQNKPQGKRKIDIYFKTNVWWVVFFVYTVFTYNAKYYFEICMLHFLLNTANKYKSDVIQ